MENKKNSYNTIKVGLTITIVKRMLSASEQKYSQQTSKNVAIVSGLIGVLRFDLSNESLPVTKWNEFMPMLKNDNLKKELDSVINWHRFSGDFLESHSSWDKFFIDYKNFKITDDKYAFAIDSDEYSYIFSLSTKPKNYICYCYCYKKDFLQEHIQRASKGIRFITPSYRILFTINDNENIFMNDKVVNCRYIDDYHTEINKTLYHIQEFAEKCEKEQIKIRKE